MKVPTSQIDDYAVGPLQESGIEWLLAINNFPLNSNSSVYFIVTDNHHRCEMSARSRPSASSSALPRTVNRLNNPLKFFYVGSTVITSSVFLSSCKRTSSLKSGKGADKGERMLVEKCTGRLSDVCQRPLGVPVCVFICPRVFSNLIPRLQKNVFYY